jgi:hypothetical protein
VPPNSGGNITFNNTYIYASENGENGYTLLFQSTQIAGQYGFLDGSYFRWFAQESTSVTFSWYIEANNFQDWEEIQLSSTQATSGFFIDSTLGLIIEAVFWRAWLSKWLSETVWLNSC